MCEEAVSNYPWCLEYVPEQPKDSRDMQSVVGENPFVMFLLVARYVQEHRDV